MLVGLHYWNKTVPELKKIAAQRGLQGRSKLTTKEKLIVALGGPSKNKVNTHEKKLTKKYSKK